MSGNEVAKLYRERAKQARTQADIAHNFMLDVIRER
jgi:hypothetical protein